MKSHKDLDVWTESVEMVTDIYKVTQEFPKEEIYGLTSQIRRAAVSVPSNIAEGAARNSDKDFLRFLYMSLGSLAEIETQLIIAVNLNFLSNFVQLEEKLACIRKMLIGLINYLKRK